MDQLKRMGIFAEVVKAGSLTGAARTLGMSPSAVSQHLRLLEHELGLALLHRSTRRLTLTEAGQRYQVGCTAMVAAAESARHALDRLRDEPEGELCIAAPIGFASLLAEALAPMRDLPRLSLRLLLDDAVVDVIDARVDLALRVGPLPDSSLVARRLGSLPRQLCAAPAYLQQRGWPVQPEDLARHLWLGGRPGRGGTEWLELLGSDGERRRVQLESHVQATQVSALHALAIAGWGITVAVDANDRRALTEGRLLPVLPAWQLEPLPVHAITARRLEQPAKVRHAMALLQKHFADAGPALRQHLG